MEEQKEISGMLDLMVRPAFCVINQSIAKVNPAAEKLFLTTGTDVRELLLTGTEEYTAFSGGCLYLTLNIGGHDIGAAVTRMENMDVFLLEQDTDHGELRSLALAARELREPLSSIIISAERLMAHTTPEAADQAARLNRGIYQMLRIIGNMSDAGRISSQQETRNICSVVAEIFEKAQSLVSHTGLTLTYEGPSESVYCLTDTDQLERAVLNLLSNAIKFTPKGGTIHGRLVRQGRMLHLSIQDSGSGIADDILGNVFTRYLRQPAIEDSRFGLGLGMVLIRNAASAHGGTVLIDKPDGTGTRVTMTLAIRQSEGTLLRSNTLRVDYTGERDHVLVELSETLPSTLYGKDET
ncbi:MAG: HAMP domain-containing sensor histidine kinase [Oscillospiraceae bacterium]|jgi:signal transduction histidine kinase|nr:HAMP domain-containing sensor histidine kinase [Oscillospiraceae bacterium]